MNKVMITFIMIWGSIFTCCAQKSIMLHYDFRKCDGSTIFDRTKNHFDGQLKGSAKYVKEASGNYADLGNEEGYIDMGTGIGKKLQATNAFTIAVRYKVDETASLKGNGYFLWAFSTLDYNTQTEGRYQAYKLNVQRSENSIGGWSHETLLDVGKPSEKGKWIHAVYTQDGHDGRLYINGEEVAHNAQMFPMSETFPNEAPTFNWLGRAPFKGDAYLAKTAISDVRVYSEALSEKQVKKLCKKLMR